MVVLCRNPQAPSVAALGTLKGGGEFSKHTQVILL